MQAADRQDFAVVWRRGPNGRERLDQLVETYRTALAELRALHSPRSAGLIASLESHLAAAARECRYLDAAEHARRRLSESHT